MSVPRWIVVDDTDPSIEYTGPWFADASGSQAKSGNFGQSYRSTLHGTTLNASLSYNFNGTQVQVIGSNRPRNDSGVLDPAWECFIDNISIGATTPFQFSENNWVFCSQNTLKDGPHTLTLNATVRKSQTFWFDNIKYVPSASVPLDGQAILIDNLDPAVQSAFDSNWHSLGGTANQTQSKNSAFTFNFTGVSLSWYSLIPTEFAHTATKGTYSVDKNTPTDFLLNGLPASSSSEFNQLFFQTPNFTQGNHQIVVLFEGNGQTTPLALDYLIVQNGTSTTGSGGSTSDSNSGGGGKSNAGIIAGGVIGGLVLIALPIIGAIWLRRRHKQAHRDISSTLEPEPFEYASVPIATSVLDGYSTGMQQTRSVPALGGSAEHSGSGGHNGHPSFSFTDVSQSTEPPSTAPASAASFMSNTNGIAQQPPVLGLLGQPSYTFPARSEKLQREAEAASAAALRTQSRRDVAMVPPSLPSSASTSQSRVLMHQDSGLRMREVPEMEEVQEIPPEYTAG